MKALWIVTGLLLAQVVCYGRDSAYKALRVAGGGDQALLNHVIEVKGVKGDPQPPVWKIVVDDPNARGGVRELEVSGGKIISEHTPVRNYAGSSAGVAMDFKRLNLDSEGAFTIANQEASKRNTGFDSIDYVLRGDDQTNAPVWVLRLLDTKEVNVGTIYISADNGAVIRIEGFGSARHVAQDAYTPPYSAVPPPPPSQPPVVDGSDPDQPPPGQGVGRQINKGLHRVGADLQQFFTGKRTWDEKFRDDPQ